MRTIRSTRAARRGAIAATAAAALALVAAGCGDDDDAAPLEPTTVEVVGVDYAFEGLPDEVAAGSTLTLTNASDLEVHELVALRLPDDETRSVEDLLALPPEELMAALSDVEPATVIVAPPESDGFAVVGDGTIDEPGRYAIVCMIPVGADPDEFLAAAQEGEGPPDVAGGPPHAVQGMYAELTVR